MTTRAPMKIITSSLSIARWCRTRQKGRSERLPFFVQKTVEDRISELLHDRISDGGSFHLFYNGIDDHWIQPVDST
jgi:hypothetical protein